MIAAKVNTALFDGNLRTAPALTTADQTAGLFRAEVSDDLASVEATWRALQAHGVESPGQSFDFIRQWVSDRNIARDDQRYVVGYAGGEAIALLPLHRTKIYGARVFTWFPGTNVGCYAPASNYQRLAELTTDERSQLWRAMFGSLDGADLVYLRSIPVEVGGYAGLLDDLGVTLSVETLYRSQYESWAECDRLQRSKSRRKHDRQQGDRLNAMGDVAFEELTNESCTVDAIDTMFQQRSARFKVMGIRDGFVRDNLIPFYQTIARPGSGIDVRLHVLRLNGDIVAVRYNVVHGDRMFCLISSMSDDPAIQNGSPGKQCLLNVMQTVFDSGYRVFDMGGGFTDEKRHWCNVQTELRHHYIGLTVQGRMLVKGHQAFQRARSAMKSNPQINSAFREVRQAFGRLPRTAKQGAEEKSE